MGMKACDFNSMVDCGARGRDCGICGWNPDVAAKRVEETLAEIERGAPKKIKFIKLEDAKNIVKFYEGDLAAGLESLPFILQD